MAILLHRRHVLLASAAVPILGWAARAAEQALPASAKALGATVAAQGKAPKPLRLAVLSFQGSSFWEAADKGIAAATSYLKPLGSSVDYIQLGRRLPQKPWWPASTARSPSSTTGSRSARSSTAPSPR